MSSAFNSSDDPISPSILLKCRYVHYIYFNINTSSSNLIKVCISWRNLLNRWFLSNHLSVTDITVNNCTGFLISLEYICLNIMGQALKTICINCIYEIIYSYWYIQHLTYSCSLFFIDVRWIACVLDNCEYL